MVVGGKIRLLILAVDFMFTNKLSKNIALSKESLVYAGIFVVYVSVTITIFVYSVRFLGTAVNLSLSEPLSQTLEQKYGQVNLDNYALIAHKLDLLKGNPNNQNAALSIQSPSVSTTTEAISNASNMPETIIVLSTSSVISPPLIPLNVPLDTPISAPVEFKPSIVVINSTLTSGLASALKTQLQSSNFEVLRIGNVRPSEVNTIIKVKANINQDSLYFSDIKKIVSERYDYILGVLEDTADHDIEVIIGEK